MYIDTIIIPKSLFPPIPMEIQEFFREPEESFHNSFILLFTFVDSIDQVYIIMDADLLDVDWINHGTTGLTYEVALSSLVTTYELFHNSCYRHLGFLRNPPPGIELVFTGLEDINYKGKNYVLRFEYINHDNGQLYGPRQDFIYQSNYTLQDT